MKRLIIFSLILALSSEVYSQTGVAINNTNDDPDNTSILDLTSTTKGILIPRMTEAEKNNIGLPLTPATGLMIYQTDVDPGFYYYSGTVWEPLGGTVKAIDDLLDGSDGLGTDNMFLGTLAGEANVVGGIRNVGLGINSLQSLTTGDFNSACGYASMNRNTTGSYNTASGYNAMYNATTLNHYNVAIGYNAMSGTGTYSGAIYNIAIGSASLNAIGGGDYNVAVGRRSQYTNSTGHGNTSIGAHSLFSNESGVYNSSLGYFSMYSIDGGDYNTGVGRNSLWGTTSGSGNIGMGAFAGDNITSGSYNIMLGYEVDAPSSTASNQLNIGNLIYGTALDGRSATLSSGNIGIGTKTPATKLDVVGAVKTSRLGSYGTYATGGSEVQGIWSISEAFPISTASDHFGTQYGMGYAYNQNGGSPFAGEHQIVFTSNGTVNAAIGLAGSGYFGGNVGIGTTSPSAKLDVVGVLELSSIMPVDPGSDIVRLGDGGTNLHIQTNYGYTRIGPQNTTWSHFYTDRSRYYFDKGITVDQGLIGSYNEDLSLQTSGTTRMTIDNSTGNVGIGTTDPTYKLDVVGSAGFSDYLYHNDDTDTKLYFTSDNIYMYAGNENLLRLYEGTQDYVKLGDGGDVDINLNDDLRVIGSDGSVAINSTSSSSAQFYINTNSSETYAQRLNFQKSGTGTMYGIYNNVDRTTSGGTTYGQRNVVYNDGGSSSTYGIYTQVDGTSTGTKYGIITYVNGSGTKWAAYFAGSGYISSGIWSASDERLKKDISDFNGALSQLSMLPVKTYHFKTDEFPTMNFPEQKQYGIMAQDLEQVFPEMVFESAHEIPKEDGEMSDKTIDIKTVNYDQLIPVTVKAIQEQQEIIESHKSEIDELKDQIKEIDELKTQIKEIQETLKALSSK